MAISLSTVNSNLADKADLAGATFTGPIGVSENGSQWKLSVNESNQLVFSFNDSNVATVSTDGSWSFSTISATSIAPTTVYQSISGSTTTFAIESGRTVDDVMVFYNGICLIPTNDYSILGTTLTTTFTPIHNSELVIRYMPI